MISSPKQRWIGIAVLLASNVAFAQTYPSKPIRVIMPLPAGAPMDLVLRTANQEMMPRLGQPLVVDARPGGNTAIGAEACARAAPDGYTLCVLSLDTLSFNPYVLAKLPYDPEKDFKPVTRLFDLVEGLMANASLPVNSVKELQALAASKPATLNIATLGPGSATDVFRQWLNERWKTEIVGIPYKGANLVVTAVVAGEVHLAQISMGSAAGQIEGGKIKLLAIGGAKRSSLLPNVPTYDEAGLNGSPIHAWWGVLAPAATPDAVISRLNAEFNRAFREPKVVEFMASRFFDITVGTPDAFASFMKTDREHAGQIVKRYHVPQL
jgi:tripartite-type tricarboxylate transporter receptor subunit TctC